MLPWPPVVAAGDDVAYDMFTLLLVLLGDLRHEKLILMLAQLKNALFLRW